MADILERDAGFCSGGDEDDIEVEDGIHSPTDASEDSVDVKVQAISLRNRNKRKCLEPRKLDTELPAKKRKIDLSVTKGEVDQSNRSPFRPWSVSPSHKEEPLLLCGAPTRIELPFRKDFQRLESYDRNIISIPRLPSPKPFSPRLPCEDYNKLYPGSFPSHQEQPLSLVSKRKDSESEKVSNEFVPVTLNKGKGFFNAVPDVRLPVTPITKEYSQFITSKTQSIVRLNDRKSHVSNRVKLGVVNKNDEKKLKPEIKTKQEDVSNHCDNKFRIDSLLSSMKTEGGASTSKSSQGGPQRNYKNMTRERRIEANARERTRVHTISAAFDTLRHSIPAYSHNQKLSKLSVLRIACSYIMTLSRLAGYDYSKDQSEPDLSNCVENVSKTIQTEGKIRKKKDD